MSLADVFVIVTIVLSGIIALRIGFVRVLLGLTSWVGATLATIYCYPDVQIHSRDLIENQLVADIAAGASVFVVSMFALSLAGSAIAGGIRNSSFGILDRTFGLVTGLIIGMLIVSGTYIFTHQVFGMTDQSSFYREARTLPLLRRGASFLAARTPKEWKVIMPHEPATKTKQTFRNLLSPQPSQTGQDRKSGYKEEERRDMDRLIRSQQK